MFKRIISRLTLLIQLLSTATVLFVIYMISALLTNVEVDMVTGIGFILLQPLMAFIVIVITLLLCLLLGLPLRKHKRLSQWWQSRKLIPVIGIGLALLLFLLSFLPAFSVPTQIELDDITIAKDMPNAVMAISGWILLAFSMLHFYPLALIDTIVKWVRGGKVSSQ
jgi:hypothetical protein